MIVFVAVVWAIDVAYEFTINVFLSHDVALAQVLIEPT